MPVVSASEITRFRRLNGDNIIKTSAPPSGKSRYANIISVYTRFLTGSINMPTFLFRKRDEYVLPYIPCDFIYYGGSASVISLTTDVNGGVSSTTYPADTKVIGGGGAIVACS